MEAQTVAVVVEMNSGHMFLSDSHIPETALASFWQHICEESSLGCPMGLTHQWREQTIK
jgi:hypothetical protein